MDIYLVGVLGALSREVFRWRALHMADRLGVYLNGTYIAIASIILILSGFTALVFAPAVCLRPERLTGSGFSCRCGL